MNVRSFIPGVFLLFFALISSCRKDENNPDISGPLIEVAMPAEGSIINYFDTLRVVATFSDVSGLNEVSITLRDAQGNMIWQPSASFVPGGTTLHVNEIVINNLTDTTSCSLILHAVDSKGNAATVTVHVTLNGAGAQTATAEDYAWGIQLLSEAVHIADLAAATGAYGACAIISHDTMNISDPDTLTVNFGSGTCIDSDGRNRTGEIQIVYASGSYNDSLVVKQMSFINYSVDGYMVTGNAAVQNAGVILSSRTYNMNCTAIINGNATITDISVQLAISQFAGGLTPAFADDGWAISGVATGHNRYGTGYSAQINNPLRKYFACWRYIVEGTVTITPTSNPSAYLDYGSAACDNVANVVIGSNIYPIYLL